MKLVQMSNCCRFLPACMQGSVGWPWPFWRSSCCKYPWAGGWLTPASHINTHCIFSQWDVSPSQLQCRGLWKLATTFNQSNKSLKQKRFQEGNHPPVGSCSHGTCHCCERASVGRQTAPGPQTLALHDWEGASEEPPKSFGNLSKSNRLEL